MKLTVGTHYKSIQPTSEKVHIMSDPETGGDYQETEHHEVDYYEFDEDFASDAVQRIEAEYGVEFLIEHFEEEVAKYLMDRYNYNEMERMALSANDKKVEL